jgi:uncharacterized protein (UPF0332 family)
MNGFLEKAKLNLIAAEVLLEKSLYASSVHCSFYACLQVAFHVLFVILKQDEKKVLNDMRQKKKGKHQHVSDLIVEEIVKKNRKDAEWFSRNFSELKTLRVKADYKDETISLDEGQDALNTTNAINNLIKKIS